MLLRRLLYAHLFLLFCLVKAMNKPTTIAHQAARNNDINALVLINKYCKNFTTWTDNNGNCPLHDACAYGNIAALELLLKINPYARILKNNQKRTPLHLLLMSNYNDDTIPSLLLAQRDGEFCPCNEADELGYTPLHLAVAKKFWFSVRQLMGHTTHTNEQDSNNRSLEKKEGASPHMQDHKGRTPLDFVNFHLLESRIIAHILLDRNANPFARSLVSRSFFEKLLCDPQAEYYSSLINQCLALGSDKTSPHCVSLDTLLKQWYEELQIIKNATNSQDQQKKAIVIATMSLKLINIFLKNIRNTNNHSAALSNAPHHSNGSV